MKHAFGLCALPAIFALSPLFTSPASAQSRPYTPATGSFERKLIMDTLRLPVERQLHKPVIFQVEALRVQNGWAFLDGTPRKPDGGPLDWRGTPYAQQAREGFAFGGGIDALLHKTHGKWTVVTFHIGASDVVYEDWDKRYHAPRAIFGLR